MRTHIVRLIGLSLVAGWAAASPADSSMQVMQRWKLGGDGGWDYLTVDAAHRLFISRGTRVDVVNTDSGTVIGSIADTEGVHGIALAADLHRGFTSNGRADSVTVFDLDTLKILREVKVPAHNPDAILYEPSGGHVFTFNGKSKDVTVIDAQTLAIVATLPVPDKPEFAVDDGAGRIYVNIESEPGQMVVIDSRKLAVEATWPLAGCNSPTGLAIDRMHHRLFSVCDGKVMAITNARNGHAVARVPIGEGPDAAAYDAWRAHHGTGPRERHALSRDGGFWARTGCYGRPTPSAAAADSRIVYGVGGRLALTRMAVWRYTGPHRSQGGTSVSTCGSCWSKMISNWPGRWSSGLVSTATTSATRMMAFVVSTPRLARIFTASSSTGCCQAWTAWNWSRRSDARRPRRSFI
jgi:YVTN family beta-propeller protein